MRPSSSLAATLLSLAAAASACGDSKRLGDAFSVMSQDLGVGADLEAVFAASTAAEVPALVDAMWAQREASSFAARADAVAAGIALYRPHLVGLQSVLQWWEQVPASPAPADVLVSDHLQLLLAALAARGTPYDPVAVTTTADIELTGASGNDYRFVDRDVILARRDFETFTPEGGTYASQRTIPIAGPPLVSRRGWAAVGALQEGRPFRFVTTKLEPTDAAIQRQQALELTGVTAAAGSLPVVVAGNLGSNPKTTSSPTYGILGGKGSLFSDLPGSAGAGFPSCCRDVLLSDPAARLDRRADWLLGRNNVTPLWGSWVNGNGVGMTDGRWPSDHAGIVAGIALFD